MWAWRSVIPVLAVLSAVAMSGRSEACPFCPTTQPTLGERVARSDAVLLTSLIEVNRQKGDVPTLATFEILQAAKAPATLKPGDRITVAAAVDGKPNQLFLLTGRTNEVIEWDDPDSVTETRYQYLVQAPTPEADVKERLGYYLKFLEFSDPIIADDAYFEFAKARYEDVAALKARLPREKLRKWIAGAETPAHRLGLYGLMLGLCGHEADAAVAERRIFDEAAEFRLGIDGVMAGYLLLKGPEGLARLEREKLRDPKVPDGEVYAAVQALRFVGQYGGGGIGRERVCESMQLLLDRPALAEFAIRDLARWNDWSAVDRVRALYDSETLETPGLRRSVRLAVLGYLLTCANDPEAGPAGKTARRHLDELRTQDAKLVGDAERLVGAGTR